MASNFSLTVAYSTRKYAISQMNFKVALRLQLCYRLDENDCCMEQFTSWSVSLYGVSLSSGHNLDYYGQFFRDKRFTSFCPHHQRILLLYGKFYSVFTLCQVGEGRCGWRKQMLDVIV